MERSEIRNLQITIFRYPGEQILQNQKPRVTRRWGIQPSCGTPKNLVQQEAEAGGLAEFENNPEREHSEEVDDGEAAIDQLQRQRQSPYSDSSGPLPP
ncbi:hypothetical protein SAY87_011267 [Trapa incisa]|uniref:Uncharacterized protein n=1 Tax=Trapa incisa TaxID=236973 RepID=A0AAN7JJ02_9MYRT|nr:hypothetical protein SAY87_011267 [Trapa incisa]